MPAFSDGRLTVVRPLIEILNAPVSEVTVCVAVSRLVTLSASVLLMPTATVKAKFSITIWPTVVTFATVVVVEVAFGTVVVVTVRFHFSTFFVPNFVQVNVTP